MDNVHLRSLEHLPMLLFRWRRERDLTLYQVEQATGVSSASLCMWESGKRSPGVKKLSEVLTFYGVSVTLGAQG